MRTKTRKEQAEVTYDECDACGKVCRTEARIESECFDPRSRSSGFSPVRLWTSHPFYDKDLCPTCWRERVHHVEGIPFEVPGMARIQIYDVQKCEACDGKGCSLQEIRSAREKRGADPRAFCQSGWIYNGHGLRLPSAPPSDEELSAWWYALAFNTTDLKQALQTDESSVRAVVLVGGSDRYWIPSRVMDNEWFVDLIDGERKVCLCESTSQTRYPTVLELLYLDEDREVEGWSEELSRRREGNETITLGVRVPIEILQ